MPLALVLLLPWQCQCVCPAAGDWRGVLSKQSSDTDGNNRRGLAAGCWLVGPSKLKNLSRAPRFRASLALKDRGVFLPS